jgi:Rrf2 family protein
MKLSTKSRYGLRAVVEIAKYYADHKPAKRKDIASSQSISDSYLENILIVLKNSRIIETTRGVNGGYVLCRKPEEISLFEVVVALEGPLDMVECVSNPAACKKTTTCATHSIWSELAQQMKKTLERVSLRDMIEKEKTLADSYII